MSFYKGKIVPFYSGMFLSSSTLNGVCLWCSTPSLSTAPHPSSVPWTNQCGSPVTDHMI